MFTSAANKNESQPSSQQVSYQADGRHFACDYKQCDADKLADIDGLVETLHGAIKAAGATILQANVHRFANGGMTAVFLLSESHASIHTYPEYQGCFIDLFTCGAGCESTVFDAMLRAYLQPQAVQLHSLTRTLT